MLIVALGANDGLRGLSVAEMKNNLAEIIERAKERKVMVILAGMEAPPNYGPDTRRRSGRRSRMSRASTASCSSRSCWRASPGSPI